MIDAEKIYENIIEILYSLSVYKPTWKNVTRYDDNTLIELSKKVMEYDSFLYRGLYLLVLSKLHMFGFFSDK